MEIKCFKMNKKVIKELGIYKGAGDYLCCNYNVEMFENFKFLMTIYVECALYSVHYSYNKYIILDLDMLSFQ